MLSRHCIACLVCLVFFSNCFGGKIRTGLGSRGLSGADRIPCVLVVINEEPADIVVGINGKEFAVPAHSKKEIETKSGTEFRVRRKFFLNGQKGDDLYRFVVPADSSSYTVTFGGLQRGIEVNTSGIPVRIVSDDGSIIDLPDYGKSPEITVKPGERFFTVIFQSSPKRQLRMRLKIDHRRADQKISAISSKWYDWFLLIKPEHYDLAKQK